MSNLMHRIWLGSDMPERYQAYGEQWKELNPDWVLHDWTEEELFDQQWTNQRVLDDLYHNSKQEGADRIAYYTQVADVIDYELVYNHGGWYFNTDLKPIKPLRVLGQDMHIAGFAMEDDYHAVNMAMYAPPNNNTFRRIIENLPGRYFSLPGEYMNATTGVQLIMQTLNEAPWEPVTRYHRDVFNPIHFSQFGYGEYPDIEREYGPETVAVHEWFHRTNQRAQRVLEV